MENCLSCGKKLLRSKRKYCSNKCQHTYQYDRFIEQWLSGNEQGLKGVNGISTCIRKYIFDKYQSKCSICGFAAINQYSGLSVLEIDHVDGDHLNNTESNLRLLCPNCHSQTRTYKNLNRNKSSRVRN